MSIRRVLLYAACFAITLIVALALGEAMARLAGFKPFAYMQANPALRNELRILHQIDPVNGYIVKPGAYTFDYLPEGGHHVSATIAENGSRNPSVGTLPGRPYLYFVGCSICFGVGVDDKEVFSNVITEKTGLGNQNQCIAGYGTLQALERLKRAETTWPQVGKPKAIVYMAATHHAWRSVVDGDWIITLDQANRREKGFKLPYARLDGQGKVQVHPPAIFAAWPLREYSALIYFLENTYVHATWDTNEAEAREVMLQLIQQMKEIADRNAIPFHVVFVAAQEPDFVFYHDKLQPRGISATQCTDMRMEKAEYQVPNDGHPNAVIHAGFAQCIIDNVIKKLP